MFLSDLLLGASDTLGSSSGNKSLVMDKSLVKVLSIRQSSHDSFIQYYESLEE